MIVDGDMDSRPSGLQSGPGRPMPGGGTEPEGGIEMRRLLGLALTVSLVLPGVATARGYRSGTVNTPFGSVNTNSPAYRMSGGDPFVAAQMQQQMQMMQQQNQMMQQQMKLEQQFQQRMKKDPAFRKAVEAEQAKMQAQYAASQQTKKKKKRPTFNGSAATAKDDVKSRSDDKKVTEEKPASAGTGSDLKNRRDDETKASTAKTEAKPAK